MTIVKRGFAFLLSILLVFAMSVPSLAGYIDLEDFGVGYNKDGSVTIMYYGGEETEIEIPSMLPGRGGVLSPVTAIAPEAFDNYLKITSVSLPDTLTAIGDELFSGWRSLRSVTFGENLMSIGKSAFDGCIALGSIVIPDSVTTLGVQAFVNCSGLTKATIGNGVKTVPASLFDGCPNLKQIILSPGVESVSTNALSGCFYTASDLYILGKETTITRSSLGDSFAGTVHCYKSSAAYDSLKDICDMSPFAVSELRATLDAPLAVPAMTDTQTVPTDGLHVYASFTDSKLTSLTLPEEEVTEYCTVPEQMQFLPSGSTISVPVKYDNQTTTYPVQVTAALPVSISVTKLPDKTTYVRSDTPQKPDLTGLVVTLTYSDGTTSNVTSECKVPESMLLTSVGNTNVPVSYGKLTTFFSIEVQEPIYEVGIEVTKAPDCTTYYVSDTTQPISTLGMEVSIVYSDGNKKAISDYSIAKSHLFRTPGTEKIEILYKDFTCNLETTVLTANLDITSGTQKTDGLLKKKIGIFSSYKRNPVALGFTGIEPSMVKSVTWEPVEGKITVDQNGKTTYTKLFAGTGVVKLSVTDIHGVVHTTQTRILFYRFAFQLRTRFIRFL